MEATAVEALVVFDAAPATPALPDASWVVKLVKPLAAIRSATLCPVTSSGVVAVELASAFATSAPPTVGSTLVVILPGSATSDWQESTHPLSICVAGSVGSLHIVGML